MDLSKYSVHPLWRRCVKLRKLPVGKPASLRGTADVTPGPSPGLEYRGVFPRLICLEDS